MTLRELLGEEVSVAVDHATVHVGAALQAATRARSARSASRARAQWERAARQFRAAGRSIAEAELVALEHARTAGLPPAAPASARAPAPPPSARAVGAHRPDGRAAVVSRRSV